MAATEEEKSKRSRVSQVEFPNNSLEQALRIPQAIWDNFAGKGGAPHQVAMALGLSPTSGGWRNLCGSAIAYGLTEGGYNAQQITLTELGLRIVRPLDEAEDARALREAALRPRVLKAFFERYDRAKFPRDDIARNVLIDLGLPPDRSNNALETVKSIGRQVGVIVDTKTGPFVALDNPLDSVTVARTGVGDVEDSAAEPDFPTSHPGSPPPAMSDPAQSSGPRHLFVAHGKNRKPLDDLKKILDQFKIPYRVAVEEPHVGRPISRKVAELMRQCSAGIFVFTKDEKFAKDDGTEIWRPSENVVYELGAANVLWENKIIIVKENGVYFPSDFSDLGYISFDEQGLSSQALDILRELVGLGLVRVQAAE